MVYAYLPRHDIQPDVLRLNQDTMAAHSSKCLRHQCPYKPVLNRRDMVYMYVYDNDNDNIDNVVCKMKEVIHKSEKITPKLITQKRYSFWKPAETSSWTSDWWRNFLHFEMLIKRIWNTWWIQSDLCMQPLILQHICKQNNDKYNWAKNPSKNLIIKKTFKVKKFNLFCHVTM